MFGNIYVKYVKEEEAEACLKVTPCTHPKFCMGLEWLCTLCVMRCDVRHDSAVLPLSSQMRVKVTLMNEMNMLRR
jgi:hypothetical protein